jgi:hypothetical protein
MRPMHLNDIYAIFYVKILPCMQTAIPNRLIISVSDQLTKLYNFISLHIVLDRCG